MWCVIINIGKENIIKIIKKEKNANIEYQKVSLKERTCNKNDKNINIKELKISSKD